ncbi:MAG TPA: hypothetical protein VLG28_15025 [Acidimicrobiia bacterium]|nr:hypothetical protein [Acidimicrobiia bacterium]
MSVGHVARGVEAAGIPTVSVFVRAFRHVAQQMALPRTVITRHPMGRPLGAPGDAATHRRVVTAALDLVEAATAPGALSELEAPYRTRGAATGS